MNLHSTKNQSIYQPTTHSVQGESKIRGKKKDLAIRGDVDADLTRVDGHVDAIVCEVRQVCRDHLKKIHQREKVTFEREGNLHKAYKIQIAVGVEIGGGPWIDGYFDTCLDGLINELAALAGETDAILDDLRHHDSYVQTI